MWSRGGKHYSTLPSPHPVPSTSRLPFPSFHFLASGNPAVTLPPSAKAQGKSRRRAHVFPSRLLDHPRASPSFPPAPVPHQGLSRITRERNTLLSLFLSAIYAQSPDPPRVFSTLSAILAYPTLIPPLRPSHYPPTFVPYPEIEGGEETEETRRPILLSLPELRRTFSILAKLRPATNDGKTKLLVVTELLGRRSKVPYSAAAAEEDEEGPKRGRDASIGTGLTFQGVGLRSKDFLTLIQFVARSFRSPRQSPEITDALMLFSLYSLEGKGPNGRVRKNGVRIYNVLLKLAVESRAWSLFDAIEERMEREEVRGDGWTGRIRLGRDESRGKSIGELRTSWGELVREGGGDEGGLWNELVWILGKRGELEEMNQVYLLMKEGRETSLEDIISPPAPIGVGEEPIAELDPPRRTTLVKPPLPNLITYSSLIQSFAHHGLLQPALRTLRDLLSTRPAPPLRPREPTFQIFNSLFRGFARHAPSSDLATDATLLSGLASKSGMKSSLAATGGGVGGLLSHWSAELPSDAPNPWTLSTLLSLIPSFLEVSPKGPNDSLTPHPKTLFWLLFALERCDLSDGDILAVWERVEEKFERVEGREGRRGWMLDRRIKERVKRLRERVALRRAEDLEAGFPEI